MFFFTLTWSNKLLGIINGLIWWSELYWCIDSFLIYWDINFAIYNFSGLYNSSLYFEFF